MMAQLDLMFSIADFELVTQAILAFETPVDATFPLDHLNEALAAFYNGTMDPPHIVTIRDLRGPIGYLITPRDDRRTEREASEAFWGALAANDLADAEASAFLVDQPCWGAVPGTSTCAVGYVTPFGPALPTDAITDAIRLLMGQQNWPELAAVYLYPVRHEASPLYSGLWLADRIEGMDDDTLLDDAVFRAVREQNLRWYSQHHGRNPAPFERKRYSW